MTRDPKKYLADMLDACTYLLEVTADKSLDDYKRDKLFRSAVERQLQNIGEGLYQLSSHDPPLVARISDHARIIRFRHVLVHGYYSLKPDVVWGVVQEGLPILHQELKELLKT
jgi:uncharacterized protein with HEPN domain